MSSNFPGVCSSRIFGKLHRIIFVSVSFPYESLNFGSRVSLCIISWIVLFHISVSKMINSYGPQTRLQCADMFGVHNNAQEPIKSEPSSDVYSGMEERIKNIADHLNIKLGKKMLFDWQTNCIVPGGKKDALSSIKNEVQSWIVPSWCSDTSGGPKTKQSASHMWQCCAGLAQLSMFSRMLVCLSMHSLVPFAESKKDLAEQIKKLEERILYLESLSPEYFSKSVSNFGVFTCAKCECCDLPPSVPFGALPLSHTSIIATVLCCDCFVQKIWFWNFFHCVPIPV